MKKGESQGGGGGTLFPAYEGSDPASTIHPKKYQEFQAPPKKIPQSVHWPNEKTLKCIEMTP